MQRRLEGLQVGPDGREVEEGLGVAVDERVVVVVEAVLRARVRRAGWGVPV